MSCSLPFLRHPMRGRIAQSIANSYCCLNRHCSRSVALISQELSRSSLPIAVHFNFGPFAVIWQGSRSEPLAHHSWAMQSIRLDTFRALLEHEYQVGCWCPGCRRWATTDLEMLVRNGLGDRSITACKARCRKCGMEGQWQVRPPTPVAPTTFQ